MSKRNHALVASNSNVDLLSAWIEGQMAYSGLPGLSIGIVYDQTLLWSRGFGYASIEKKAQASPDTLYRIASITKLFTSTALLILRDSGLLQLDDPVEKHLSWFRVRNPGSESRPITIRRLLTHTSGLPSEAPFPYWTDSNFPTVQQIQKALPGQEPPFPPEHVWKYSNLAMALAGQVVEAVSGRDYASFVQEHILDPLEMVNTHILSPDPEDPKLAVGYGRRLPDGSRPRCPFTDCKGMTPAANMTTSVNDLARFCMLQFRDEPQAKGQILSGQTLREMQRVHWLKPDWQSGSGLGFAIMRQKNKTYVGHGGSVRGYRTQIQTCPEDKIAVIVLTNADDGVPLVVVDKAFELISPDIKKMALPEKPEPVFDPDWNRYVGKYRSDWNDWQVLQRGNQLVMIDPTLLDPLEALIELVPVQEHVFRAKSERGYANHGELVQFELDEDGRVFRLKEVEYYSYPVENWQTG